MGSSEFTRGGYAALKRAAALARQAGKMRSTVWLGHCAEIVLEKGYDALWPPAPAYKGIVVHAAAPQDDLARLTDKQLDVLRMAVRLECDRRGPEGMP